MAALFPAPFSVYFDNNGNPLAGGLVYTYVAGTTTPLATYTDSSGGTPNTNPVVLDSAGRADIWYDGSKLYKIVLKTSAGATVKTVDNVGLNSSGIYFKQLGSTVSITAQAKMQQIKNALDLGCACDGSTDDWSIINTWVMGEVAAGRTPWLSFPPGTTTMVSQALPWRDYIGYVCIGGWATIKAHPTSTDNVIGEANPGAAYSYVTLDGIIVDGNRDNVSYNTRNAGATDDSYQNGIRLNQVSQGYFRARVQNSVFNGWSIYNASNENIFVNPWAIDIGKSTNIVSGAASYNGMFFEFGINRNQVLNAYVHTTRDHGIWETGQGADNYDNQYINPLIIGAGSDGIRIGDEIGSNTTHRPKIVSPTVISATDIGIRLRPNSGAINDATISNPLVSGCASGILTQSGGGNVNRLCITAPNSTSNTNAGISIANSVDTRIIGGHSLSNGTNYTDSGTRTITDGLIVDTGGAYVVPAEIQTNTKVRVSVGSGSSAPFTLEQSGVSSWDIKNEATTGDIVISQGGTDWIRIKKTTGYILPALPTSSAGLPAGALWSNAGVVTVA